MGLWKVNGEVIYSQGSLSIDPTEGSLFVTRHTYEVPRSTVGKGGILKLPSGTYHTPSWIKVHPQTTLEDITQPKLKIPKIIEVKVFKFKSSSSDKTYTVTQVNPTTYKCNCFGFFRAKREIGCKHVQEVKKSNINLNM